MKNLKKVLLTVTISLATLLTMSVASNAATVKVTGDVINIRKEASTDSTVIATLSKDVECEYLGEEGDWYQVRYENYTGYVSKQYSELVEDTSDTQETNPQTDNNSKTDNNSTENNEAVNNENQTDNENTQQNNEAQSDENTSITQTETTSLVYKKFNQNTIIRILPLIYSSNIGEAKNGDEVLVLTEVSGWSYIQTDKINGWVRTDTLGESKPETTDNSNKDDENAATSEKTGYISEDDVNLRKGAGTSYSVIEVLELNTQVTILEEDGDWYRIKIDNTTGYVSKDYVSDSKKVTSRSLSEPRTDKDDEEENTKSNTTEVKEDTTSNNTTTSKTETTKTTNSETKSTSNSSSSSNKNTSDTIKGTDVIAYAKKFLGHEYVWGGDGSNRTFDCSGFTMYVYKHFGVSLPHYTVSQYNSSKGTKITKQSDLKMGDIVFLTDYETGAACGHCGIYISDGDFIHADSSVGYVNISNLNDIYKDRFCGALRIIK